MAKAVAQSGSLKWLIRALGVGAVFLVIMLAADYGPKFPQSQMLGQAAGAVVALCLIVAAVSFVLEVVRRVIGP